MTLLHSLVLAEIDWGVIINSISLGIVMILTAYMKMQTAKATTQREDMKKTLRKVEIQGDGQRTELKKTIAISAENLALATNKPAHKKIAAEAWQDYEASVRMQNAAKTHESHEEIEENLGTILDAAKETATAAEVAKVAADVAVAKVEDTATHLTPAPLVPLVADKPVVVEKADKPDKKAQPDSQKHKSPPKKT